jgi:hypothetical protein
MTHEELQAYRERFHDIMSGSSKPIRNTRLVRLMEDMQQCYNIPIQNDVEFNKQNKEVVKLYREVSAARF